ncbi:MAG: purine-nucleoside phosphorylase [Solobacterium sp.]|jgi:purine-nucleoside phosphorylase|nr:purine-nucleoside phosphorylase [Solobacterium sp.]MCH4049355.1 purine-nucleoside phosphorylase [Solobacterium sp.]MCH4075211.1 purine-nucleoside phosphorylase [Solobacterium sp.]MCI1313356.1 purine-nucleoside phosphorylase [Solobacterium sp.]MCI1345607.1 purine-nucleoside phosphorylase [Solobacterium sp.]
MANKESISASIVQKAPIAKVVLMPGDPLRAKTLADNYLSDVVLFNDTRNMLGFTGTYQGKTISVMGHGMGVPSIGIYTQELYSQFGVDAIIRIGSAGGLDMSVNPKDVVIAEAASTNSNYGNAYGIPGQLAACADWDMLKTAYEAAEKRHINARVGKVYTSDFFYYPQKGLNEKLRDFGHLCVEMETAGLYWTACANGKKALSILSISDHLFKPEALSAEERQNSFTDMMLIALDTAVKFAD